MTLDWNVTFLLIQIECLISLQSHHVVNKATN